MNLSTTIHTGKEIWVWRISQTLRVEQQTTQSRVHSGESEQFEDTNPFGDPVLRAAWERLKAKGPEYFEELRREVILGGKGQCVPDLPERLKRGPKAFPSSSGSAASSSGVGSGDIPSSVSSVSTVAGQSRAAIRITASNPWLKPLERKKTYKVSYRNFSSQDLARLQLQVKEGQETLDNKQAVISWDYHQVLDTYRHSARKVVRASGGIYPKRLRTCLSSRTSCVPELLR